MKFQNKNILLISPEPWNHIFVSKHHYAIHLAQRGNKIFFLSPPTSDFGVSPTQYKNVCSVNYKGFPSGLRFFPAFAQRLIIRRMYERIQSLCKAEMDIVWSFDNSVFFDFSALPAQVRKICHIVDLNQNFQTAKAAATADICFCTTELIRERLVAFNSNVYKINHGFNQTFQRSSEKLNIRNGRTTALYAGNLGMPYIDWALLYTLVSKNPQVDFYFLGPVPHESHAERDQALALPNVHRPGKVNADELQGCYSSVDLLLIAYQERYHRDQSNPHKMMEYLGSGKMIIATQSAEYRDISRELFYMSESNAELPGLFAKAIVDLSFWNSEEKQQGRQSIALDNTYEKQLDRIQDLISSLT